MKKILLNHNVLERGVLHCTYKQNFWNSEKILLRFCHFLKMSNILKKFMIFLKLKKNEI